MCVRKNKRTGRSEGKEDSRYRHTPGSTVIMTPAGNGTLALRYLNIGSGSE